MVDQNTDFFQIVDNFAKTANIPSIPIIKSNLNFLPKFTIAIPTYKRPKLLKEALDSALNQTICIDYEVIVVDNNPERGCDTEKLMNSYNDTKLSYFKNSENLQMAGNWNRCFELANGNYVVMLHDDDILLRNFLEECNLVLSKIQNISILKPTQIDWIDDKNSIQPTINQIKARKIQRLYDLSNYSGFQLGAPTGCLFKKQDIIKMGGYNHDFYPNFDFCYAVLHSRHFNVYKYNQQLFIYRWAENDSRKTSSLEGFVKNDYFLINQILKNNRMPKWMINCYLRYLLKNKLVNMRAIDMEFSLKIEDFGIKELNRFSSFIIKKIINVLRRLIPLLTTTTINQSWKE